MYTCKLVVGTVSAKRLINPKSHSKPNHDGVYQAFNIDDHFHIRLSFGNDRQNTKLWRYTK